jgi:hypothetical protein
MSLTEDMVIDYLQKVSSLKAINNHDVKDSYGCKTGQMPLSINIGKQLIDQILEQNNEREEGNLSEQEEDALIALRQALNALPISMSIQALASVITGIDNIQKTLFAAVKAYLTSISQFEEHKMLLKSVALVLKILEYDLSKNLDPITVNIGYGIFSFKKELLSTEQKSKNHGIVQNLLSDLITYFESYYVPQKVDSDPSSISRTPCLQI